MDPLKLKLLKHKWLVMAIGFLVVVTGGYLWLINNPRGNFVDERVVYIRSIDRENLTYYATVDDVRASLDDNKSSQTNTRDFSSIQKLALAAGAKVSLVNRPEIQTVSDLQTLLLTQSSYTGKVFTVSLNGDQIISLKEENLE